MKWSELMGCLSLKAVKVQTCLLNSVSLKTLLDAPISTTCIYYFTDGLGVVLCLNCASSASLCYLVLYIFTLFWMWWLELFDCNLTCFQGSIAHFLIVKILVSFHAHFLNLFLFSELKPKMFSLCHVPVSEYLQHPFSWIYPGESPIIFVVVTAASKWVSITTSDFHIFLSSLLL